MTTKTKTTFILLFTLLIGVLLGIFLDRTIMKFHFQKRFAEARQPRGITRILENLIRPDETQYEAVRDILDKYAKKLHDQREKSFQQMEMIMDSLRTELDQVLTEEQKARLNREMERMRQRPGPRPRPGELPPPPPIPFDRKPGQPPRGDERHLPPPLPF